MKYTYITIFCLLNSVALAQLNRFIPDSTEGEILLGYNEFVCSYNPTNHQPNWVLYELSIDELVVSRKRCDCFKQDKFFGMTTIKPDIYVNSGYDKGHLTPAAHNNLSGKSNRQSFLMTNIVPQLPKFNRGIWRQLENWTTRQVMYDHKQLYVITGGILKDKSNVMDSVGNKIPVPKAYYKAFLVENEKSIAFIIPHNENDHILMEYAISVDILEEIINLDLFYNFQDSTHNAIEATMDLNQWKND